MKALYEGEFGETSKERLRKKKWLTKFKDDGYRLIDAIKEPVGPFIKSRERENLNFERKDHIIEEILQNSPCRIVLIKATVFDALYDSLHKAGLPVVNEKLAFPSSGRQKEFDEKYNMLISDGTITLTKLLFQSMKEFLLALGRDIEQIPNTPFISI